MHHPSTRFPQTLIVALVFVLGGVVAGVCAQAPSALLFRIFLADGTTLVSYGEFARVGGRVAFSVPVGDVSADPKLQVVTIDEALVDWEKTDAYAEAVRARHYAETRGEADFAILTGHVTAALNQIALTADPLQRLALAEEARRNLSARPAANHNYRAAEVAELVSIFDDVIAELRVEAGVGQFDLSLVARTEPPPPVELLPVPDLRRSLEMAYRSALLSSEPAERTAVLKALEESMRAAPRDAEWANRLRRDIAASLAEETRTDKAYGGLTTSLYTEATKLAEKADVKGLQALIARALQADERLGRKRPAEMAALLAALDARLDEARRLRLARDAWALRVELIKEYRESIDAPLARLAGFRKWLESIRDLEGPEPKFLRPLDDRARLAHLELMAVTPPPEVKGVHGLIAAALHMTRQAASLRLTAVSSNDIKIAWDASAAAAGAINLADQALAEFQRLISSGPTR
jgi:hypothetical protein